MRNLVETKELIKGLIPPQALDLERAVLGGMIIGKQAIESVVGLLTFDMFYKTEHKLIYKAIYNLYVKSKDIDLLTISDELTTKGDIKEAGGQFYLIELSQKVASTAHIVSHADIIVKKYSQRELIKHASEVVANCYKDDANTMELLDSLYSTLNEISELTVKSKDKTFLDLKNEVIDRAIKIYDGEIKSGIETPIRNLTKKSGGWRDTELIIMAARPGMGKTAFALQCATEPAKNGTPTAFFSLETSARALVSRVMSSEFKVDNNRFTTEGTGAEDLSRIGNNLNNIPFHIDDTPSLSIEQFQIKAKRLVNKHKVELIVIDYLQLMTANAGSREQEISKISRGIKKTAMELDIPIIALSQLSRAVETRGGSKRPLLSDLRESGAIEQDADMVMFLFRPEYYGITEWDDYDAEDCEGQAEYIIAKNRNGGLVRNRMKWEGRYTSFSNIDDDFIEENTPIQTATLNEAFGEEGNGVSF